MCVLVIGRLEQCGCTLLTRHSGAAEHGWRRSSSCQQERKLSLDAIDKQATTNRGAGGDRGLQPGNLHHRIPCRRAGIKDQVRKVLQLLPSRVTAPALLAVVQANDRDNANVFALKYLRHLNRDDTAAARTYD